MAAAQTRAGAAARRRAKLRARWRGQKVPGPEVAHRRLVRLQRPAEDGVADHRQAG